MKIKLDFDELQTADDGETTHYGGIVKVNDREVQARGTDREWNLQNDIQTAIEAELGRPLTDDEQEALNNNDDFLMNLNIELEYN